MLFCPNCDNILNISKNPLKSKPLTGNSEQNAEQHTEQHTEKQSDQSSDSDESGNETIDVDED